MYLCVYCILHMTWLAAVYRLCCKPISLNNIVIRRYLLTQRMWGKTRKLIHKCMLHSYYQKRQHNYFKNWVASNFFKYLWISITILLFSLISYFWPYSNCIKASHIFYVLILWILVNISQPIVLIVPFISDNDFY